MAERQDRRKATQQIKKTPYILIVNLQKKRSQFQLTLPSLCVCLHSYTPGNNTVKMHIVICDAFYYFGIYVNHSLNSYSHFLQI